MKYSQYAGVSFHQFKEGDIGDVSVGSLIGSYSFMND